MPANPKHLTQSGWQRFAKITAGIIGGYLITVLLHMCFALLMPFHKEALITSILTLFMLWCVFTLIPFLFKSGWKAWLLYLGIIFILLIVYYFSIQNNPFIL